MKHFFFYSLRGRLIFVLLLAMIPALVMILYTASEERRRELAEVQDNAMRLASIIAVQEDQLLATTRQLLVSISHFPIMTDGRSAACNAVFSSLRERHFQRYSNIGSAKLNGDVFCSAIPLTRPVNIADREYFKNSIETRDFSMGDYMVGRITGRPAVIFSYPVIDKKENIKGVVFAAMDLEWFNRFEFDVESLLLKGSTLTKIDSSGIVLSNHRDHEKLIGKPLPLKSLLKTIKTQGKGVVEAIDSDGIPRIYAFRALHSKIATGKMYMILGMPTEVAFAEVNRILTRNLFLMGLVALLMFAAIWIGSDRLIMRPVNKLVNATRQLSNGDLDARSGVPYRQGELGQLSSAFDEMARTLQRREEERKQADEQLKKTLESLRKAFGTTVNVMVSAVETRDPYTSGHQIRSANIARAIATELGLPQDQIEGIRMAGSIHDIGKLSVPAEILSKPGKLFEIEFSLIKEHARKGFEMLKDVESPWPLAQIVYQHHERIDGSGYPRGLKGDDIIIEARIMAVADVVESMASHRPYRPALGINAALEEIEKNKETLYDVNVADACLRLFREKGFQLEGA